MLYYNDLLPGVGVGRLTLVGVKAPIPGSWYLLLYLWLTVTTNIYFFGVTPFRHLTWKSGIQMTMAERERWAPWSSGSVLDHRSHYHPCSNLDVGISEGCFILDVASLPLEVARPI